jgi:dimethylargininase
VSVALIRRPGPGLADGIVTHLERVPVDVALAQRQWEGYVYVMAAHGWDLVEVPPADDCPDAVFVEDALVMFRGLAVLTRPGADSRKPEVAGVAKTVESLGLPIARIEAPGTLDGGDVLKVGGTVYVGRGGRTNGDLQRSSPTSATSP